MRVTVGILKAKADELGAGGIEAIEEFADELGLSNLKEIRLDHFKKYGILVGDIDSIEVAEENPYVDFVDEVLYKVVS